MTLPGSGALLDNLLNPWLLARVANGLTGVGLCCLGLVVAAKVVVRWRPGASSEAQLSLERQAELAAAVVQAALVLSLLGLVLTVLAAERLTGAIRGAMCAYGVLASTDTGFASLLVSALAAAACVLWTVLHRFDLRLGRPALTRRKFVALFLVVPLVFLDLGATLAFVSELDFSVIASCCSVWLDGEVSGPVGGVGVSSRNVAALLALAAAAAAVAGALAARRRPGAVTAYAAALLSVLAAVAAVPAILWYVAPHAYATPHHLCPFCLLKAHVAGIGWPLFAALFAAVTLGMALGVVELNRSASGEPEQAAALERTLGLWTAVAWLATVSVALLPVARYLAASGGVSVLGEV